MDLASPAVSGTSVYANGLITLTCVPYGALGQKTNRITHTHSGSSIENTDFTKRARAYFGWRRHIIINCVFVLFRCFFLYRFVYVYLFFSCFCLILLSYVFLLLRLCILIVMYVLFCIFCFHRANWHFSATLTEDFLAKMGHGPHSSQMNCVVLCAFCV